MVLLSLSMVYFFVRGLVWWDKQEVDNSAWKQYLACHLLSSVSKEFIWKTLLASPLCKSGYVGKPGAYTHRNTTYILYLDWLFILPVFMQFQTSSPKSVFKVLRFFLQFVPSVCMINDNYDFKFWGIFQFLNLNNLLKEHFNSTKLYIFLKYKQKSIRNQFFFFWHHLKFFYNISNFEHVKKYWKLLTLRSNP